MFIRFISTPTTHISTPTTKLLPIWCCIAAILLVHGGREARADGAEWHIAPAPLLTRWAKEVSPDKVRPEYPRPQLERKEWKSLNGLWQFAFDDGNRGAALGWQSGQDLAEHILVPFTFEAALSGIGKGKEVHERVWYRRQFDVPSGWRGRRVMLNFGAVDWESTVWVNGRELGVHRGGYAPFQYDITDALKPNGLQEVVVGVYDPADPAKGAYQPKGKQLGSEGIWYTRTTGIWQSVWLEPVAADHIVSLRFDPGETPTQLALHLDAALHEAATVAVHITLQGRSVYREEFPVQAETVHTIKVDNARLWWPEIPTLYDVTLTLKRNGRAVDEVTSYAAFRTVGIADGRLTLNGKAYFYRGVLDQGYWPDGILTPPSDEAIRADVEMMKKFGLNMARKHVKIEDPRWYYWCDKLGLAVWQDMPSSHNLRTDDAKQNFAREWQDAIAATRFHPCVVQWIPFNENWGDPQAFQDEIVQLTRQIDPTRPITDASGWTQRGLTDVIDAHDYGNNLIAQGVQNPVKPKVVGEFGGIALPIPHHTWTTGWGYQTVRDSEGLLRRIRSQVTQLYDAPNLSGFVYTQLTDVEQELNGLMTYDRLPKADPQRIAAVFQGIDRTTRNSVLRKWLVLGPIPAGTSFETAEDNAANRAAMAEMLAKAYLPNEAALQPTENATATVDGQTYTWKSVRLEGDQVDFQQVFGGQTDNAVAYAVATFDSPREVKNATLIFGSDDGATVWLNGKQIWTIARIRGVGLEDDVVDGLTLRAGRNVLVVKVGQGVGGWGFGARFESPHGKTLHTASR